MLHLTQRQTLQQKLSPAQVQYLKILQLPVLQLEQTIKNELEQNPMLEEGLELDEELEESIDQVLDQEEVEAETGEEVVVETPTASSGEEEYLDKEIREHSEEEYTWEEFLENNEGHASQSYYDSDDDREIPTPATVTMRERLLEQIQLVHFNERERVLAEAIAWNLDDDGYLRTEFKELVHDLNVEHELDFSLDKAEDVLRRIQRLDPPGIASRDLRECLIAQLEMLPNRSTARIIALRILRECYDAFSKKHFARIMQELHISEDMLKKAFGVIRGLNPKPGDGDNVESINYIIPDFIVVREDDDFVIHLNDRGVPPLRLNRGYRQLLAQGRKSLSQETRTFLKQKMDAAKWFIQSIHQRRQTMLAVMSTIIDRQREWFEKGKGFLRPMVYKDIADTIQMDISTISRVVNGKYVQTEWGVFELRYFFSEGITTETGEEVANKEVMSILKDIIDAENPRKPLSDQELTNILQQRGFTIARRTVAKYRESMDLPVARLRKRLE